MKRTDGTKTQKEDESIVLYLDLQVTHIQLNDNVIQKCDMLRLFQAIDNKR